MTKATPSAVPASTEERPIILQWAERILAGDPKGTYTEQEFAAQLVILIRQVETLEGRDAHVAPLMEALEAIEKRAQDERYGIQAQRLSDIAEMANTALLAAREAAS
ncbi:hypothetical protein LCGC14_1709390 [marine sediment metagenome]|uniref:Uncharacterized protein n=1 Tax=marine sediment metagenome TaxID=412755 RepID=A0A0F9KFS3_9ZZZZ